MNTNTREMRNRLFDLRIKKPHEVQATILHPLQNERAVPRVENLEDLDLSLEELREVLDEKEQQ